MKLPPPEELRTMIREIIRDVAPDVPNNLTPNKPAPSKPASPQLAPVSTGPMAVSHRNKTEAVRLSTSAELQTFVFKLLELFENPKSRQDLRAGRLKFTLAPGPKAAGPTSAVHRIDEGVVTERHIARFAESGARLVLGRKAVITPLAREKARALGVSFEKER